MEQKNHEKTFISTAELAHLLGISRVAVFKKIQKGQIPAHKIGRSYAIALSDVSSLLENPNADMLTETKKEEIHTAVEKVVREYGETLKLLGKE
jgi:excisionase family DNA binding protein